MSINNYFNKKLSNEKTSKNLYKIYNFAQYDNANPGTTFSKTPKAMNIPVIKPKN